MRPKCVCWPRSLSACAFAASRVDDQGILDPLTRLDRLLARIDQAAGPVVLMGSSLGAYVSGLASLQREVAGLFLLAPPVRLRGLRRIWRCGRRGSPLCMVGAMS
ncbi:MAG: hypothetical protein U1F26_11420 [Lysobacterales bacterium]